MSGLDNIWNYETHNLHMALKLASFTIATEILASISRARGMLVAVMGAEFGYATLSLFIFWIVSQLLPSADTFLYVLLICNIIVFCYYIAVHRGLLQTSSFSFADLKKLIVLGIPILIQITCVVFLYSAGHYYLTLFADVEELGLYSFAFSLAIAGQIGVQSVLWAKFFEMLSFFGKYDSSANSRKEVIEYRNKLTKASQAFLVISFIAIKLFLMLFISNFFPEFTMATPVVIVIYMALYWPILATSEATLLLAKKCFIKLYLSSGSAICVMALLLLIFSFNKDAFSNFGNVDVAAFVIFSANLIFYCMLKIQGGRELGLAIRETIFDITKTLGLVSILVSSYYHDDLVITVLIMIITLIFLLASTNKNEHKTR